MTTPSVAGHAPALRACWHPVAESREIAPGVPWTFSESGGHAVALALKSGNFGAETFFADALAALEAP